VLFFLGGGGGGAKLALFSLLYVLSLLSSSFFFNSKIDTGIANRATQVVHCFVGMSMCGDEGDYPTTTNMSFMCLVWDDTLVSHDRSRLSCY
jgi:hypothetical protein